jgi:hypothetical protein
MIFVTNMAAACQQWFSERAVAVNDSEQNVFTLAFLKWLVHFTAIFVTQQIKVPLPKNCVTLLVLFKKMIQ